MFDLTGNHLAGYMIRVIRDVVARNPRFRKSLGDVSLTSNNQINYKDVQCVIKDISAAGHRLSPDYFMYTQMGRAIMAKIEDKEGAFFEWVDEIDPTLATPIPGIYYFSVKGVDERTRQVDFLIQSYKWYQGSIQAAAGSRVGFAPGIDATTVTAFDTTTQAPVTVEAASGYLYLLSPVVTLGIKDSNGNPLTANTQYWIERVETDVVLQSTSFGTQPLAIPSKFLTVAVFDNDGYELRPGIDYQVVGPNLAMLSAWTTAGLTLSVQGRVQADPTIPGNCINPENTLDFNLLPGEELVADQLQVSTQDGDQVPVTVNADGTVTLNSPLPPGGWVRYEARVLVGESTASGEKMAANINLIPGLRIAIGDAVVEGDQCAILISPVVCETYRVYGSKDNVSFAIDIKANDPSTVSDLAEMLKAELLVNRRALIESDGLTILEASRSGVQNQRDRSGTAPGWISTLQVTSLADWRVYKPLVNRVTDVEVLPNLVISLRPKVARIYQAVGARGFLPDYR